MTVYTNLFDPESATTSVETDCPLYPYLNLYIKNTGKLIEQISGLSAGDKKTIVNGFLKSLTQRIMNTANNVLVAEREILAKTLNKESVSSAEFYTLLRGNNDYLQDILTSYPELHRILIKITQNYVEFTGEFCMDLAADKLELFSLCSVRPDDSVAECDVSMGETHRRSRTVVIVKFSNLQQVVYKPRSLYVDESASNLLKYLRSKASGPYRDWIIPSYVNKPNHGWAQHTGQLPVQDEADISTYYKRMGFLLGFCTSVTASDITSDNLIAHGPHPVPIDLETVFYSVLAQSDIPREVRWNSSSTSILPNWTWKGADGIGVDLSAVGGLTEQYVSINFYQQILDGDKDGYGMDGVKVLPNANVLYHKGNACCPWLYEREIREGFERYFEIARENIEHIKSIIISLKGTAARYVPRPTATYHYAVQCSLHPTLMASTYARKSFLEKILSSDTPPAIGFLESEVSACLDLDIPYAQIMLGRHDFIEPAYGGSAYLEKNQFQDGISHSIDYLESMSKPRMKFELNLISNSLTALGSMYEHKNKLTDHRFRPNDELEHLNQFDITHVQNKIAQAYDRNVDFISSKLEEELSFNGLWLGFHTSPGGYMEYSELGDDFYYGVTGILYGYTVASQYTNIPRENLCKLADFSYLRVKAKFDNFGTHLGGFHFGLASTILPLYLSMKFLEDKRADSIVHDFKKYLTACLGDEWWQKFFWGTDLMSGTCGCLAAITKLYELTADEELRSIAGALFSKIHEQWISELGVPRILFDKSITTREDGLLSGLSHGVMGCAYSVFYYNEVFAQDPALTEIFLSFLTWELDEFNVDIQNWKDYRKRSKAEQGEFAWSHGLPGNYLAIDYFAKNNVKIAGEFIKKNPPENFFSFDKITIRKRPINDSLCHGAYGLLNIIKQLNPKLAQDHRVHFWANLPNFCDQDTRQLRVRTADPFGLWVGKTGSILGAIGLLDERYTFPFLPHQMESIA